MPKICDMKDTALCVWYQKRYDCMYGRTHGVEKCDYGKPLSYDHKTESKDDWEDEAKSWATHLFNMWVNQRGVD